MIIKTVTIAEVKPYQNNPRKNTKAVEAVAESIRQCGYCAPIVVDEEMVILAGHTRLRAVESLGWANVEVCVKEGLTDEQRRKYRLLDNKTNELAEWDFELLADELSELDFEGFDFGFPPFSSDSEVVEDNYEVELPLEPKTKLGDIYQLGRHRLMCGDSTDKATVEKLMDGAKADMVFTDPPYGMNLDTDYSSMQNHLDFAKEKGFTGGKKYDSGVVDDFNPKMISTILDLGVKETFLWGADYFAELLPDKNDGSWVVWDKRANDNDDVEADYSSDKMYGSCFELCWSKNRHKRDIARVKWAGVFGTEQEFDRRRHHPTQKPIKLSTWFIERYSKEDENIIDLFGGSGSTLIACEQLNRTCYMMELDPKYCDVIIDRWEMLMGEKVVKL